MWLAQKSEAQTKANVMVIARNLLLKECSVCLNMVGSKGGSNQG